MIITENRLRRIIRSVIAENLGAFGSADTITVEWELAKSNHFRQILPNACDEQIFNFCISDAKRGGMHIENDHKGKPISYATSRWVLKDGDRDEQNHSPSFMMSHHLFKPGRFSSIEAPDEVEIIELEINRSNENGNLCWTFIEKTDFISRVMFKVILINNDKKNADGAWSLECKYIERNRRK